MSSLTISSAEIQDGRPGIPGAWSFKKQARRRSGPLLCIQTRSVASWDWRPRSYLTLRPVSRERLKLI